MDIRESYCKEMDSIKHDKCLDKKILETMNKETSTNNPIAANRVSGHRRTGWKTIACAAALVCVVLVSLNFDTAVSYALSLWGRFSLFLGGKEIMLDEMTPVAFSLEQFLSDQSTKQEHTIYWSRYETAEQLQKITGMTLEASDQLVLKDIVVSISPEHKTGHLTITVCCGSQEVHMNGMFVIEGYNEGEYGYGEEGKAYYTYEYADGKKAYFVKRSETQGIYFTENGIMYQLFVEQSQEGKELGKRIVNGMAEH